MPSKSLRAALALALAASTVTMTAAPRITAAQPDAPAPPAAAPRADRAIAVTVGSATYTRMGKAVSRVAVADAQIASVTAFDPDQLLISGLRPGQTTATVWIGGEAKVIAIEVGWPVDEMRGALRRALPGAENLEVAHAGRTVILSGKVGSAEEVERAEKIVGGIAAGVFEGGEPTIVNALAIAGAQQVQLEVSFAEVSRSSLRAIGFNFWSKKVNASGAGFSGGVLSAGTDLTALSPDPASSAIGNLAHDAAAAPLLQNPIGGAFGFVFSSTLGGFPFSAALSLLSSRGYARTLAEPTLVAMSGKTASFLAGGEFPVPLPQALGQLGVQFRKFGIQLVMTPTVAGPDITLDLGVTVSDVDPSLGIRIASTQVPGLRERHSETSIRLVDGQSFVIAGLISDEVRSSIDKVPMLGDIPILGALFRSSSYRRQETELLVVVTAHLVRPLDKKPALPGEHTITDPSDLELFLLGRGESKPVGAIGFKR